ncbi:MAG: MTH1187 family thiamine-binding protein [Bacteroidota bacterium]|nr:MTH1187 family thiamine-binding protein [Bacteroidota bacterium]
MVGITPIGVGMSLSPYIATCVRTLREAGLTCQLHAHATDIEGDWGTLCSGLRQCFERLQKEHRVQRISLWLKVEMRSDREPSLEAAVQSVEQKLHASG